MTTHILGDNVPRKSNFDPDLARKVTKYYEEHPEELKDKPQVPTKPAETAEQSTGKYILMPETNTYALGVHALQEACLKEHNLNHPINRLVYRPNTFLENIQARINDFYTIDNPDSTPRSWGDRLSFFNTWLDSCCGVASQAKTTKLKLNLKCQRLIGIDKDFKGEYLPVNYAFFPHQVELDSSSPTFMRDGWMALLEERKEVYSEYLNILKKIKGIEINPSLFVQPNTSTDKLRALLVSHLISKSTANGSSNLNYGGSFLRRNPS